MYLVGGFARTPIGRLDGNLKTLSAEELAVEAVHAVLSETGFLRMKSAR